MTQYQWMVAPVKCGNVWKIGVQTENGCVSHSKRTYATKEEAQVIASKIYIEEEFAVSDFEIDC
jgi:hypothetical protein